MELMTATPFYYNDTSDETWTDISWYENYDYSYVSRSLSIMFMVVCSLAFVLGVLGNGVVIWVTGFKMKKTVNTVWFLNLAVADFLFTAFLPLTLTEVAMDFHWPFGKFMCKLNTTIRFLNMYTSVYILMVISVDKCVSVVWPVWAQNHRNVQKASSVSLCVWVLALILSAPYFVFSDTTPPYHVSSDTTPPYHVEDIIQCIDNFVFFEYYQAMTVTRCVLGFVISFTVIVSCYVIIIHRLSRNRMLASQSSRPFKIIAAIVTFFLCWAPFHIMNLFYLVRTMTNYSNKTFDHIFMIGGSIAINLAFLNSCLNPLLYVFMGQDFKDKICKSILKALETTFQEEVSPTPTQTP